MATLTANVRIRQVLGWGTCKAQLLMLSNGGAMHVVPGFREIDPGTECRWPLAVLVRCSGWHAGYPSLSGGKLLKHDRRGDGDAAGAHEIGSDGAKHNMFAAIPDRGAVLACQHTQSFRHSISYADFSVREEAQSEALHVGDVLLVIHHRHHHLHPQQRSTAYSGSRRDRAFTRRWRREQRTPGPHTGCTKAVLT